MCVDVGEHLGVGVVMVGVMEAWRRGGPDAAGTMCMCKSKGWVMEAEEPSKPARMRCKVFQKGNSGVL